MKTHFEIVGVDDPQRADLLASVESQAADLAERHEGTDRRLSLLLRPARAGSFEARLALRLPARTLGITAREETPDAAISSAFDMMEQELQRQEAMQGRAGRRRTALALREAADDLETQVRADDRRAFEHAIRPRLDLLRRQARRELLLYELEGRIDRSGVAVDGVVDEVVLRAWEAGLERPADSLLDHWLLELLHQVIDERAKDNRLGLVDAEAGDGISSEAWWPLPDDDGIEELLGEEGTGEISEMGERWKSLPTLARRAAALHLLDGYSVNELDSVFDVSSAELRQALDQGAEVLGELPEES